MPKMTSKKPISIIVAHDLQGVIGYKGKLPWNLPSDLAHFRDKTFGNPVIMGRKTYQSILHKIGKPLSYRTNIVVSGSSDLLMNSEIGGIHYYAQHPGVFDYIHLIRGGVHILNSTTSAVELAQKAAGNEIFVIGGAEIYKHFLEQPEPLRVSKIYRTLIYHEVQGDTYIHYLSRDWEISYCSGLKEENGIDYEFETLSRM